ncbi:MAG TPA: hypothetical protein VEU94_09230 [Terriglobales bacterium]|nr:hypothetical protein [Terriglobales bacterium]
MPDDVSPLPPIAPEPAADPAPEPALDLGPGPGVNIGEEFGTAKRNLPPAKIVGIVLAAAALLLGIFAFLDRAKPQGGGSVDNIAVAEIPNQNAVLVAVNVTLHNAGEKPLWIHDIKSTLKTDAGEFSDVAASAVDYDRYFQAFPTLKERALAALPPETKIPVGGQAQGTVVVSFPVTQDGFDKRKSLSVIIQPYDQPLPVVLTK